MKLTVKELQNKILGCWTGKNIGGALGIACEGMRGQFDFDWYIQPDIYENTPANDDLDLQLVWMGAVEKHGRKINADILADYWLSYIGPDWCEYGVAKANLKAGMFPPITAGVGNSHAESCGAFIRSEIWACLCPGLPELATRYAYEDAIVDHNKNGVYGELFCAALESAAFVENDKFKLLDIALSYIPKDCEVAKAVNIVIDGYKNGKSHIDVRKQVMMETPCTFGIKDSTDANTEGFPLDVLGMDAPANIAFAIIGLLYGEDDFGKSLCIAVNCGEDSDCSAATLGALLGIMLGYDKLPEKWLEPIGGKISTMCIDISKTDFIGKIPATVGELTERVIRLIPRFLDRNDCDVLAEGGYTVKAADNLYKDYKLNRVKEVGWKHMDEIWDAVKPAPYIYKREGVVFTAYVDYMEEPFIRVNEPRKIKVMVENNYGFAWQPQWIGLKVYTPDYVTCTNGNRFGAPLPKFVGTKAEFELEFVAENIYEERVDIILDLSIPGRHTTECIKVTLFAN